MLRRFVVTLCRSHYSDGNSQSLRSTSTRPDCDHPGSLWCTGKVPPLDSVGTFTFVGRSSGSNLPQRCITHTSLHSSRLSSKSVTSRQVLWHRLSKGIIYACCLPTRLHRRRTAPVTRAATINTSNSSTDTTLMSHPRLRTGAPQLVPSRITMDNRMPHSRLIHITGQMVFSVTRFCWRRTTG